MPARYHFQFRFITTLAAAAGIALTLALANWQLDRAHEKERRAARLALARQGSAGGAGGGRGEGRGRGVAAGRRCAGSFEPRYGVLIDNRIRHGVAGYHVVMPLAIGGGSRYVLVNRGWIAGTRTAPGCLR